MQISEVTQKTNLSPDTLRYYERIGLLPPVTRTESGIRDYQGSDIKRIEFIKCMRQAGIPVKALNEYLALAEEGDATLNARKAILVEHRARLQKRMREMQETLDLLDYKIKVYEDKVMQAEKAIT